MDVEAKVEYQIETFNTYDTPQWQPWADVSYSKREALDMVNGDPGMRVMERTVVTIKGAWSEVT